MQFRDFFQEHFSIPLEKQHLHQYLKKKAIYQVLFFLTFLRVLNVDCQKPVCPLSAASTTRHHPSSAVFCDALAYINVHYTDVGGRITRV